MRALFYARRMAISAGDDRFTLTEARHRVARARMHAELLHTEFEAFPDKEVRLRSTFDATASRVDVVIARVPEFPLHWSFEASEALFNLRAALDYTAWQLAMWNLRLQGETRDPASSTQFPIAITEKKFNANQVKDLHPDHVAIIRQMQPFGPDHMANNIAYLEAGVTPEMVADMHLAAWLAKLNNHDKHRLLHPTVMTPNVRELGSNETAIDCTLAPTPNYFVCPIEVGQKWAEFPVIPTGPDPRVEVPVNIDPTLGFGGLKILDNFPMIEHYVVAVIQTFERLLA